MSDETPSEAQHVSCQLRDTCDIVFCWGMRKMKIYLFLFIFLFSLGQNCLSQEPATESDQAKLKEILKKTATYCERLKTMALDFICNENIKEETHNYRRVDTIAISEVSSATRFVTTGLKFKNKKTKSYIYDYQMIKKGDAQEEKRILLQEGEKKKRVENAELKIERFKAQFIVFGPVGFLSRYWQRHFNYEIIGQDEINGNKTIIISATPTEQREENYNFGKIWVDENDFSIIKIEWDPTHIPGFVGKSSTAAGNIKSSYSWAVFYEVEKNGVRFPSRQIIEETLTTQTGKEYPRYLATFVYDEYKFFTVQVEVKHD